MLMMPSVADVKCSHNADDECPVYMLMLYSVMRMGCTVPVMSNHSDHDDVTQ